MMKTKTKTKNKSKRKSHCYREITTDECSLEKYRDCLMPCQPLGLHVCFYLDRCVIALNMREKHHVSAVYINLLK